MKVSRPLQPGCAEGICEIAEIINSNINCKKTVHKHCSPLFEYIEGNFNT